MNPFKKIKYNIDHFLPSKIIGWVSSEKIIFDEICLASGNKIICKSLINIQRNDVFEEYGGNQNSGFNLDLPDNLVNTKNRNLNLVAKSFKNKKEVNLKIYKKKNFSFNSKILRSLLSSDLLGLDGHFNGKSFDNEYLNGWISSLNFDPPTIWLNMQNNNPIPIKCDEECFKQIENRKFFNYSFYIDEIPIDYKGEVWITFDKEGLFRIPQDDEINIETIDIDDKIINLGQKNISDNINLQDLIENTSIENRVYVNEIVSFDIFLDDIDKRIKKNYILSFSERILIMTNLLIKPFQYLKIIE
mgnify:CR=1 FL=1